MPEGPFRERDVRRLSVGDLLDLQLRPSIAEDRPSRLGDRGLAVVIEPKKAIAIRTGEGGPGTGLE
jgi:hypothetical protein